MAKSKRKYQWVGGGKLISVQPDTSTSVADVMEIVPAVLKASVAGPDTSYLLEAMYIKVSTRRIGVAAFDAAGIIVWTAPVVEGGDSPAQTLDAVSTDARAYANKCILLMEALPVPALLATSDLLAFVPNDEVVVTRFEYQAKRKIDRSNTVLALIINSDLSNQLRCFVQVRALLSYGS